MVSKILESRKITHNWPLTTHSVSLCFSGKINPGLGLCSFPGNPAHAYKPFNPIRFKNIADGNAF